MKYNSVFAKEFVIWNIHARTFLPNYQLLLVVYSSSRMLVIQLLLVVVVVVVVVVIVGQTVGSISSKTLHGLRLFVQPNSNYSRRRWFLPDNSTWHLGIFCPVFAPAALDRDASNQNFCSWIMYERIIWYSFIQKSYNQAWYMCNLSSSMYRKRKWIVNSKLNSK